MSKEIGKKAELERARYEQQHGKGQWPPVLQPPSVSITTMLEWHEQGCEWPVGGDETVIANSKNGKRT